MDIAIISSQIQKFRKQLGMTQKELGAAIGVSTQAVSQWENGGAPDVALLPAIADKLGVTVDALFGREGGEVRDMTETLTGWLRSKTKDRRFSDLTRLLWEAAMRMVVGGSGPRIEYPKSCRLYDGDLADGILLRLIVQTDDGSIVGVGAEDMSYMCVFPKPEAGFDAFLLSSDVYRELFSVLCLPGALELLRWFSGTAKHRLFAVGAAAKRAGVGLEDAKNALEAMTKAGIFTSRELELEDGPVTAYMLEDDSAVVPFLQFAGWLRGELSMTYRDERTSAGYAKWGK